MMIMQKQQSGFTLIEVLIAMVISSIAILGMMMLQLQSLKYSQSSFERSLVMLQASDLKERTWTSVCDPLNAFSQLTSEWTNQYEDSLHGWEADARILSVSDINYRVEVEIKWYDRVDGENGKNSLEYSFLIPSLSCS